MCVSVDIAISKNKYRHVIQTFKAKLIHLRERDITACYDICLLVIPLTYIIYVCMVFILLVYECEKRNELKFILRALYH